MAAYFDHKFRVGYVDTDKMGIVHNSNYFRYFEIGRIELMRHLGVSYKTMEDNGVMMPLIEQYAKYLKPAYFDEELICEGYNVLAFINEKTRKPHQCPDWIKEKLKEIL